VGQLLQEKLVVVDRDVLHPVQVSTKERKSFTLVSLVFSGFPDVPSHCFLRSA
jgi:hypothetical protein